MPYCATLAISLLLNAALLQTHAQSQTSNHSIRTTNQSSAASYPCELIHQLSSGVCVRGGLEDYPTKKDLPKYIHSLFLAENRLSSLNSSLLETFCKLRELDISQNRLEEIKPGAFSHGRLLRKLNLNNNRLTHLNANMFEGTKNLLTLDVSHNFLRHIAPNAFKGLRKLNRLWMQHNQIRVIEQDTFKGLKGNNIEFIFLQNNHLLHIMDSSFDNMPELVLCQLTNNRLRNLSEAVISQLGINARFINWEGNPWHCDCDFSPESVSALHNESFKEPIPQIQCQSQEPVDCEQSTHLPRYSVAAISSAPDSWTGGAIAGMFFAVLLTVSILCIGLSLVCGIKMKRDQRKKFHDSRQSCTAL